MANRGNRAMQMCRMSTKHESKKNELQNIVSRNKFTAISPNSKVKSWLKKSFADSTRQVDDVQHNYTQNTLNINKNVKSSKRQLLYYDDENNTKCKSQLTHTISKYDYELTPNGNKEDEELLDINNLSFILAEDFSEDPSVVIPVVTPPLQLHSTENLALPLESLDNTDQPIIINNDKDVLNKSFVSAMLSITTDPEYNEPITKVTGGRKRFKANQKKLKKLKHNYIEEKWSIECNHQESSTKMFCKVKELSDIDIVTFKKNLCKLSTKIDQDKFLLNFLSISNPKRKNRRKEENQRNTKDRLVIKYVIPSINEGMIPVCSKSFTSITSISRRRLNLLSFKFNNNHASPKEKRGGKRINQDSIDTTESIKSHIMTYKIKKAIILGWTLEKVICKLDYR